MVGAKVESGAVPPFQGHEEARYLHKQQKHPQHSLGAKLCSNSERTRKSPSNLRRWTQSLWPFYNWGNGATGSKLPQAGSLGW